MIMRLLSFVAYLIDIVTSVIVALLGIRLAFRLFGANEQAPFVAWIIRVSEPFLAPFVNIFPSYEVRPGFVLELTTVFALVIYAIIGYLIVRLFEALYDASVDRNIERRERTV